jgi:hypothetical protein
LIFPARNAISRVSAVVRGWVASSGLDKYGPMIQPVIRALPSYVPLRRIANEAEVAAAIVFLLSPAAGFISGSCLRVDGAAPNARLHAGRRKRLAIGVLCLDGDAHDSDCGETRQAGVSAFKSVFSANIREHCVLHFFLQRLSITTAVIR